MDRICTICFKASETLLGIETQVSSIHHRYWFRFKASETLLGIETHPEIRKPHQYFRFKASETLLGIETQLFLLLGLIRN